MGWAFGALVAIEPPALFPPGAAGMRGLVAGFRREALASPWEMILSIFTGGPGLAALPHELIQGLSRAYSSPAAPRKQMTRRWRSRLNEARNHPRGVALNGGGPKAIIMQSPHLRPREGHGHEKSGSGSSRAWPLSGS